MVRRCRAEGLIGGEGLAVDASLIEADASRQTCVPGAQGLPPDVADHAVIVDVEPSTAVRQAEAAPARTMIERTRRALRAPA